jgi:hypothetical protein
LEQLCPLNVTLPSDPHFLSLFHTSSLPVISIRDYLYRLSSYTGVSDECLIQACIHILTLAKNGREEVQRASPERTPSAPISDDGSDSCDASTVASESSSPVSSPRPGLSHPRINSFSLQPFQVSAFNIHRLLLTAILTSAKFVDDGFYNNKIYSSLGGISLRELNRLECEFLILLEYRMHISADVFIARWESMNAAHQHGAWCTKPHHPIGPRMVIHPEDPPTLSEDEHSTAAISELDVAAFPTTQTIESVSSHAAVHPSNPAHCHSRQPSLDDPMHDVPRSASSSTNTTPIYSFVPSVSPSSATTGVSYSTESVSINNADATTVSTMSHEWGQSVPMHDAPSCGQYRSKDAPLTIASNHLAALHTFQHTPHSSHLHVHRHATHANSHNSFHGGHEVYEMIE